jgi:hypothetical protein
LSLSSLNPLQIFSIHPWPDATARSLSVYPCFHLYPLSYPFPPPFKPTRLSLLISLEDTPTANEPRERYCLERGALPRYFHDAFLIRHVVFSGRTIGLTTCPVCTLLDFLGTACVLSSFLSDRLC